MVLAVTIFPDKSLFSVIVVFVILFIALDRILFKPLFRVMDKREQLTEGVFSESKKTMDRYATLLAQYEQSIRSARGESYQLHEQTRAAALRQNAEQLQQAHSQAEIMIQKAKQEMQTQVEQAKTVLATEATATAQLIFQTILQRPAGPADRKERQP